MRKGKLTKQWRTTIIVASVAVAMALALIITNIFVPVKYLTAYFHAKKNINPQGQMRVRYIDVGYGDCSLIELPDGKVVLIDGGTGTYSNVYKLLNTLNSSGIKTIDYLVCTSVKSEHCGSLAQIVKYINVKKAYIPYVKNANLTDEYAAFHKQLLKSGTPVEIAECGKGVYSDEYGYYLSILSPTSASSISSEYVAMNDKPTDKNINNASIALLLGYADKTFLFLSDAGKEVQSKIADTILFEGGFFIGDVAIDFTHCTVIKAANHCASEYANLLLYDLLQPETAIISVGKNAQGCPSNMEISNIQSYVDKSFYRTDTDGTITVTVTLQNFNITKGD